MKKKIAFKKIKIPGLSQLAFSFKAVTWPTAKDIFSNLFAVIIISAIIGAYLLGLDSVFSQIRNLVLFN